MKRYISWILLLALFLNLVGCGKSSASLPQDSKPGGNGTISIYDVAPPELTGVIVEPADGIGKPGVDFKELETGPANDWGDTPIPFFNPLGSLALYDTVNYEKTDSGATIYMLDGYTPKTFPVYGETWYLSIPSESEYSIYWMRWYAKSIGATHYPSSPEHASFSVKENDKTLWWVDVHDQSGSAYITVVKTTVLPTSKVFTQNPADWDEKGYHFYTQCTPGKLQSATVTIKGGADSGFILRAEQNIQRGAFNYAVAKDWYSDDLNSKKADTFVLDDLPIGEGMLYWSLTPDSNVNLPEEISFQINDVADIEKITWSSAPGAIRLKGVPMGEARLYSPDWASITHDDISYTSGELNGINDQNGDTFFVAPAGYYQINFPSGLFSNDSLIRLVPISAGEITTVTIPQEMKATVGAMSRHYGDFELNEGGIELLNNKDNDQSATVSFVLNDPFDRDVTLQKEDLDIKEDGAQAVVTKIEREPAGSDVILVLDSSGSMGANMKPCIEAARRFVQGLPENSSIRLVQFAQAITVHKGEGKQAVLKALDTVKEGGATSLYDATDAALKLLAGKKRGYAVVFSDGADSREPNIDGTGSSINKEHLIEKISASGVTVLTIGFGKGHDPATLLAMAGASAKGAYFAAADQAALPGAFASVAGKLGNQFMVTYDRPSAAIDERGSVPVVSLMIDRSGSMDSPPEPEDDSDYRIDEIKKIFHDFVVELPNGTLMQAGSFAEPLGGHEPLYDQITTDQKAPILQALGSLTAGGGTPTLDALQLAYQNLAPIPSNKRVLVFFTDAALQGEETEDGNTLDDVLAEIKRSGIRILFVGLANKQNVASYDSIFKSAAQKAGGDYILTDNVANIATKLDELLKRIDQPQKQQGITFSMGVNAQVEDGSRMDFYTSTVLDTFAKRTTKGQTQNPESVTFKLGEKYITYDQNASKLLYGGDQPAAATRILGRLSFDNKASHNAFAKLGVTEAYWLDTFKGINAPSGKLFLALNTNLEFAKSDSSAKETTYQVPNIFNHLYVSCNEGQMMPASNATWLTETPFLPPGENGVAISKGEPASGIIMFLIDDFENGNITQLSLHLYDVAYGHIEQSLIGRKHGQIIPIEDLPQEVSTDITDAFSLAITGQTDRTELEGVQLDQEDAASYPVESKKNTNFRIVEARFDSKVQALLDVDPMERFLYQLETDQGMLLTPMSDIVYNLPLGFTGSTMLAPGSRTNVRMPFILSNELLKTKSGIFGNLKDGTLYIPVTEGTVYKTGSIGDTFSHEYFDLTIHSLSRIAEDSNDVVLDFTLSDKKDGEATGGLEGVLLLQPQELIEATAPGDTREQTEAELRQAAAGRKGLNSFGDVEGFSDREDMIPVNDVETSKLLYGAYPAKGQWAAYDGQKRRGLFVFSLPDGSDPGNWVLSSAALPNMKVPVSSNVYPYTPLLATTPAIPLDDSFNEQLEQACTAAIAAYNATRPTPNSIKRVGLSDAEILGDQVPAPSLTLYGSQLISAVQNERDFFNIMNAQKWLPGSQYGFYNYAPEAVLTQNFGGENDLYNLAKVLLTRIGCQPKHQAVKLTQTGLENLQNMGKSDNLPDYLPALSYTDASGTSKVYVPVFSRDITELGGLCTLMTDLMNTNVYPQKCEITIEMTGKLIGDAGMAATQQLMGDFTSVLSGEESGDGGLYETVTVFNQELLLPNLSLDSIDISYISTAKSDGGELLLPVLDTRQGLLYDAAGWVDTANYEFESIQIKLANGGYSSDKQHTTILQKGQKITEISHTLAWGVPEIRGAAAASIENMAKAEVAAAKNPPNYSVTRWLGHAAIARLVKGLTDFGQETAENLQITAGRTSEPIALMVTMKSDGQKAESTVDLIHHRNQLHNGDEDAQHAYNLFYGMFASEMEAKALLGGEGISYLDVWSKLPDDANLTLLAPEDSSQFEEAIALLTEKGYPQLLIDRLTLMIADNPSPTVYLLPDKPAEVNGKKRWAWLEINQITYEVVSVFETGERAGMAEYIIGFFPKNIAEVGAGALLGATTAGGAVVTYTLTGDDYGQVLANAKALCKDVSDNMDKLLGITGSIEQAGNLGAMSQGYGTLDGRLGEVLAKMFEMIETQWLQPNFAMGYKIAVKAYFEASSK